MMDIEHASIKSLRKLMVGDEVRKIFNSIFPNDLDEYHYSSVENLLIQATIRGKLPLLKFVVEELNVKVEKKRRVNDMSLLSCTRNLEILRYLIDKGCDVNFVDREYYTPIVYMFEDVKCVELLLEHGAICDTNTMVSLVHLGSLNGVKYLVKELNINPPDIIFLAIEEDQVEIVRFLLQEGASNVNARSPSVWNNPLKFTPLDHAVSDEMRELLLDPSKPKKKPMFTQMGNVITICEEGQMSGPLLLSTLHKILYPSPLTNEQIE
jgi:hypothetical protein